MTDPRWTCRAGRGPPSLSLAVMGGADPASGFMFPVRLVLVCTGSPLPWTPFEEARATGFPQFGVHLLFN